MCLSTPANNQSNDDQQLYQPHSVSSTIKILLRQKSFHANKEEKKEYKGYMRPSQLSTWLSTFVVVILFIISEKICKHIFDAHLQPIHQIFESDRNRAVLARHIGVDAFASLVVSYLGYANRHLLKHVLDLDNFHKKGVVRTIRESLNSFDSSSSSKRIFGFAHEGHLVLIYFLAYQIKNLHDTIKWNDGILFVLHHILAGIAAYIGMYPGVASSYSVFFMGMSEISTCILCLLANFDDQYGVVGLEVLYPKLKTALGVGFAITFIYFRIILWPVYTFHFVKDANAVIAAAADEKDNKRKMSIQVKYATIILVSVCKVLSFLQLVFLGQIIFTTYVEVSKMLRTQ